MPQRSTPDPAQALILFAHGSRREEANQAVAELARQTADSAGFALSGPAFLELAEPDLSAAVRGLAERGARRIVIVPYFLVMGVHLKKDFPELLEAARRESPGVELIAADALGGHPGVVQILSERAREALADS